MDGSSLLETDGRPVMHQMPRRQARLRQWAATASVSVALALILAKLAAWWITDSVAMFGSMLDSGLDLAASSLTFLAIRTAILPPDANHRFGHGKAEALASLGQAAVMAGTATFLLFESLQRLADPVPIVHAQVALYVSVFAICVTAALILFQKWVIGQTGSIAIHSDSRHYRGDLFLNLAVIAAIQAILLGAPLWIDPLFGLGVAAYIGWECYRAAAPAVDVLMDTEFSRAERERIFNLVLGNDAVRGLHDLKTRNAGSRRFIQMHVELDGRMSLKQAHMVATELEATVGEVFDNTEILIHMDPVGLELAHLTLDELKLGSHRA
ncbi:MAG: cation diffusion facilitator family transporter [Rhodothalassiaceae bacterium]